MSLTLPFAPTGPAVQGSTLWFWDSGQGTVVGIDTVTRAAGRPIDVGDPAGTPYGSPMAVAAGASGVWVADAARGSLDRLDLKTSRVITRIPLDRNGSRSVRPYGLAVDGGTLWTTDFDRGLLVAVDAASGRGLRTIEGLGHPSAVAVGFGSVWVYEFREGVVARVDGASGRVLATIDVPTPDGPARCAGCAGQLVIGTDAVWLPLGQYRGVARIDASTGAARAIALDVPAAALTVAAGQVWVVGASGLADPEAALVRLDEATGDPAVALSVPFALDVTVLAGVAWVGGAEDQSGGQLQAFPSP